jgi:hypothetical protein
MYLSSPTSFQVLTIRIESVGVLWHIHYGDYIQNNDSLDLN